VEQQGSGKQDGQQQETCSVSKLWEGVVAVEWYALHGQ
jgi:hypothetical protein